MRTRLVPSVPSHTNTRDEAGDSGWNVSDKRRLENIEFVLIHHRQTCPAKPNPGTELWPVSLMARSLLESSR
jgi:hypothetical protein